MNDAHADKNSFRFQGLSRDKVEENREKFGINLITPPLRNPWWNQFLEKFDDPIIRILMIAAFIAVFVGSLDGHYIEGVGIIIAILLATTLAFLNEYKAGREFDILNRVSDEVPIKVIREGCFITVPRKDLVKEDLVLIEAGDEVPADGVLLESVSLQIDESKLTGESQPVPKHVIDESPDESKSDEAYPSNKIMRGTMVSDGHGLMEVIAVGDLTEIGKAARAATEELQIVTPLNRQLEKLSKIIGVVGFFIAGLTFFALVGREVVTGDLILSAPQWCFTGILGIGIFIGLIRVWLPLVLDAFEIFGRPIESPAFLESNDLASWLKMFAVGGVFFGVFTGLAYAFGLIPSSPENWLPLLAIERFLSFFMIAVTIVVVAVPEGLAMSVTLSLAYSMRRMTAANNLVRRMHACETIGAATVICSDKTGTLTLNKMIVHSHSFPALKDKEIASQLESPIVQRIFESIAVNSTANLSKKDGAQTTSLGNPTEGALLLWLESFHQDYLELRSNFSINHQLTFSTERKFMATLGISNIDKKIILYVKGAPEIVLGKCAKVLCESGIESIQNHRATIEANFKDFQSRGMRVLGFAFHENPDITMDQDAEGVADDLVWLGSVAIADPIRQDVPDALKACRSAGVKVKMITGDHSVTALEIAKQIGLLDDSTNEMIHITGPEFSRMPGDKAKDAVENIRVLSRARPGDKMRMVKLLQQNGHVVAVTGDGTNDAPALNQANVGLAMGMTGTSVAKEASDIILLDDSFPSVVSGIMWGRSLYENIQRFILFQLTINVVALGIALLGPFIGVKMPLTVIQMLWVNLIMDTFAALALATEPPHWRVMKRPPRKSADFIVSSDMVWNIFGVGSIFLIFLIWLLMYIQENGVSDKELSVFFTVFIMLQFWNLFNARCLGLNQSAFKNITANKGFMVITPTIFIVQILIVQFGGEVFRTVPLTLLDWLLIVGGTSIVLWCGEIWRYYKRLSSPEPLNEDNDPCAGSLEQAAS